MPRDRNPMRSAGDMRLPREAEPRQDAREDSWRHRAWDRLRARLPAWLQGVVARQGRGELRPWLGIGVLTLLPLLLGTALAEGLALWVQVRGSHMVVLSQLWLLLWLALLAWSAWAGRGCWRWLRREAAALRARRRWWPALAGLLAVALAWLLLVALCALPRLSTQAALAVASDPLGEPQLALSGDGARLRWVGPLARGSAAQLQDALSAAPRLQVLELHALGGRLAEAEQMAALLRPLRLATRAIGPCGNACLVVYQAGALRELLPPGQLVLHREPLRGLHPLLARFARSSWADAWQSAGLSPGVLRKGLASAADAPWVPAPDELIDQGLITLQERILDLPLPAAADAPLEAYEQALAANPVWQALGRRSPGLLAEAASRIEAARRQGLPPLAAQAAAQQVLDAWVQRALVTASAELQAERLALLGRQMAAAAQLGGEACGKLPGEPTLLRQTLPPALAMEEARWLMQLAAEEPLPPPKAVSPLEREVLRRSLSDLAAAQLPSLWQHGAARLDCERVRKLAGVIEQLPPAERRLALRAIFRP